MSGDELIGNVFEVIADDLRLSADLQDELGLDGILAELNPGSLIPHAQVMRALELLCKEVMPRFK